MYTDSMHIDLNPRRAVFVFLVMEQSIWGYKFEDGGENVWHYGWYEVHRLI